MSGESKKKTFKFTLQPISSAQIIKMPEGSRVISVAEQGDQIVTYAIVRPLGQREESHEFRVVGTGRPIGFDEDQYTFLGTVSVEDGLFMFHVFERLKL